ncbi:MAG: integrin alpha, partial [Candidatus Thiodiazotropha taylori]|nr:integrin alpha [Candidatus Thiodiazotropha taylori]
LAGIGDLNQDDHQDLAVGAPFDDNGGTDKGATWILFLGPTESHYDTSEGIIFGSLSSTIQQQ